MTDITGGELFARALAAEEIDVLFGLPSPEIDPLFAQLDAQGVGCHGEYVEHIEDLDGALRRSR